jgi:hypothetical protein
MVEHVGAQKTEVILRPQGSHLHFPQVHHSGVVVELLPTRFEKTNLLMYIHRVGRGSLALESLHRSGIVPRAHPEIDILIPAQSSFRIKSCCCPTLGQQRIHTG